MNHVHQPKLNDKGQVMFSSPRAIAEVTKDSFMYDNASWIGEAKEEYIRKTRTGDVSRVAAAEKLLNQIEPEFNRDAVVWQNSVSGAYADVAAFLANDPECMRRRFVSEDERAPLRVWVDVASSCSISWQDLLPRGIAALALVMQLIRNGRAVELWTFASLHGAVGGQTVPCVQMCTTPIDIASVAYCLTSQGFSRGICYAAARQFNRFNGMWGRHYVNHGTLAERIAGARNTLQGLVAPQDIILPAPFESDKHDKGDAGLIFRDPVQWVLETCKRAEEGGVQ